jgi:hypothetical protein
MTQFLSRSLRQWFLVAGSVGACIASPMHAQAALTSSFSSAILSGWSAGIGLSSGAEDDLQFLNGAGVQAVSYGVGANAAKLIRLRKNILDGSVSGSLVQYPQQQLLNQRNYDVGAGVVHTFSRFSSATLRGQMSSAFINRLVGGTGPGVFTGQLIEAKSRSLTGTYQRQLRRSIVAGVNGGIQRVSTGTPGFGTGQFSSAGVSITGQLNRETELGAGATFNFSQLDTTGASLPVVTGTIAHRRRSGLNARASVGAAVGPSIEVPLLSRLYGSVSGGYGGRWGEVSVEAQRTIGQQFGAGTTTLQEVISASISASKNFTRQLSAGASAGLGGFGGVETGSEGVNSRQTDYSGNAAYRFSRSMSLTVRGVYRRQRGVFNVDSRFVNASFAYGWSQSRRAEGPAR